VAKEKQTMKTPTLPTIAAGLAQPKSSSTCARLLALAGLEEMLKGEGGYTVFAPTDKAFEALPPGTLQSLENDPARLRAVLEYHILSVGRELSELRNGKHSTLEGTLLTAAVTDDGVRIDHAHTHGYPLRCANGVIHQIDAVLFPGFTPQVSANAPAETAWSGRRRGSSSAAAPATPAQHAEALFKTPE
jgi:uncharacterized surface protein with fasciclin (FAS1) repeats